ITDAVTSPDPGWVGSEFTPAGGSATRGPLLGDVGVAGGIPGGLLRQRGLDVLVQPLLGLGVLGVALFGVALFGVAPFGVAPFGVVLIGVAALIVTPFGRG